MIKRQLGKITKALAISVLALGVLCSSSFAFATDLEGPAEEETTEVAESVEVTKGSLTLYKFTQAEAPSNQGGTPATDASGLATVSATRKPVKGIAYKLIKTHTFEGTAKKGQAIHGKFVPVTGTQTPIILVTNSEGKVEKTDLELGRYKLQEFSKAEYGQPEYATALETNNPKKEIPAGVVPNTTEFTVEFPYATLEEPNKAQDTLVVYPKNQWESASIKIVKGLRADPLKDETTPHKDVEFKLYIKNPDFNQEADISDTNLKYIQVTKSPLTDTPLEIRTGNDGTVTVTGLVAGETYYIEEIPAEGSVPSDLKLREITAAVPTEKEAETEAEAMEEATIVIPTATFTNDVITKNVKTDFTEDFIKEAPTEINKEFEYRITARIPKQVDALNKYEIIDTINSKVVLLGFVEGADPDTIKDFTVTIDGTDASDKFTLSLNRQKDKISGFTLAAKDPKSLPAEGKVEIHAKAIVKFGGKDMKRYRLLTSFLFNDVEERIEYPDPTGAGDPKVITDTDRARVKIFTGRLKIQKFDIDKNNGVYDEKTNYLDDATFKIYSKADYDSGDYEGKEFQTLTTKSTNIVDNNRGGFVYSEDLPLGDYVLVETVFPTITGDENFEGRKYVAVNDFTPVKIRLYSKFDRSSEPVVPPELMDALLYPATDQPFEEHMSEAGYSAIAIASIPNTKPHWWLPFTGGNGVRMFTIGGVLLMTLSVGFAIAGKRRKEEAEA